MAERAAGPRAAAAPRAEMVARAAALGPRVKEERRKESQRPIALPPVCLARAEGWAASVATALALTRFPSGPAATGRQLAVGLLPEALALLPMVDRLTAGAVSLALQSTWRRWAIAEALDWGAPSASRQAEESLPRIALPLACLSQLRPRPRAAAALVFRASLLSPQAAAVTDCLRAEARRRDQGIGSVLVPEAGARKPCRLARQPWAAIRSRRTGLVLALQAEERERLALSPGVAAALPVDVTVQPVPMRAAPQRAGPAFLRLADCAASGRERSLCESRWKPAGVCGGAT
jgi:hypothetical protein